MASKVVDVQADEVPQTIGMNPDEFVFETIHEEAARQIDLTIPGDRYVGKLVEKEWIDPLDPKRPDDRFLQIRFRDPDGVSAINCGYELTETFKDAPLNEVYLIELRRYVDVGEQSSMKSYRVDMAKRPTNADNPA
jgi:hypothetical protein